MPTLVQTLVDEDDLIALPLPVDETNPKPILCLRISRKKNHQDNDGNGDEDGNDATYLSALS